MDKSKLKEIADSVFKRYPKIDKVFATSDGQAFFDNAHAKNHAVPNKKHKELKVEEFLRNGGTSENAKTLIAEINAAETVDAVTAILEAETAGENRKSVIEAANKRVEKLKTKTQ